MEFIKWVIYASIYIGLIATSFFVLSFLFGKKQKLPLFADAELPKVSVLIPAYNEESSIAQTIESIIAVDYPKNKLEVIVIDDGSKDKTLEIAKKYESKLVKVFHKENAGKGAALNFALTKVKSEFVVSMDADTYVAPESLRKMMRYFKDEKVMCVSPAMVISKPTSLLQRVQYVEYLTGLFLRKAFASVNAIHITPGAFSAYRKSFFDKHGGYEVGNITEDLEVALRIQYNGYIIQNCPDAPVYTIAPTKFVHLLRQRRRWYIGLMKNTWKYRGIMFNPKYGDLGMFVFPIAWISIFFSVFVTTYFFFKIIFDVKKEILFLQSINFDFSGIWNLNFYFIERTFFWLITNPIIIFMLIFISVLAAYLIYASDKVKQVSSMGLNIPIFFALFAVLFGFWWIVSLIYVIFNRKVKWR